MVADLFHYGHVEFLKRVSDLGDYVLIGIHSDNVVESYKRRPIMTMEERILLMQNILKSHQGRGAPAAPLAGPASGAPAAPAATPPAAGAPPQTV